MNISRQPLFNKNNNHRSSTIALVSAAVFLLLAPEIYAIQVNRDDRNTNQGTPVVSPQKDPTNTRPNRPSTKDPAAAPRQDATPGQRLPTQDSPASKPLSPQDAAPAAPAAPAAAPAAPAQAGSPASIPSSSVDSTNIVLPAIQGRQRYVNVNNVSSAPTYNNRQNASIPNYGRATSIQCSNNRAVTHISENNQTPTYPATLPSNKSAFQSGNYRYDPYCSSASSALGTCIGHNYMRQINQLDELTVICGSELQLPWRSFDIYNPSGVSGDPGPMNTL